MLYLPKCHQSIHVSLMCPNVSHFYTYIYSLIYSMLLIYPHVTYLSKYHIFVHVYLFTHLFNITYLSTSQPSTAVDGHQWLFKPNIQWLSNNFLNDFSLVWIFHQLILKIIQRVWFQFSEFNFLKSEYFVFRVFLFLVNIF